MTDQASTTFAIFTTDGQDEYGRPVRDVLMYVAQGEEPKDAFDTFAADVGIGDYTIDDHIIEEVPASWMDEDYGAYDYPEDEIL